MLGFCMQAPQRSRGAMLAAMDADDTLVLILERIDSPVTLIRAASTCRRWRRIVADAGFLRRFRSLHGPPVAGDFYNRAHDATGRPPSFVPSSSSIDARHFSLDFVVDASIFQSLGRNWDIQDPVQEDEAGGRIGMSNFRILCTLLSCEDGVAYTTVFTVGSGNADSVWSEMAIDHIAFRLVDPNVRSCYLGTVLGSSYYYVQQDRTLITQDRSTGKFSSAVLSLDVKDNWDGHNWTQNFFVVDGGDGEPRIVTMRNHTMEVLARVDGHWGLEKKVRLSKVTRGLPGYQPSFFDKPLTIMRRGVGFVVMSPCGPNKQWPFSVDLKTMEVAPAAADGTSKKMQICGIYPCEFPWPPVLQACLD